MQHATFIIHSESTTGVEAAILNAPVINLSPPLAWRDRLIVSEVNPTMATAGEAIAVFSAGAIPAPKRQAQELFPVRGGERTAELIAKALPRPQPIPDFRWYHGVRHEMHKTKFTVSLEEMRALVSCDVVQLDDSIFLLRP
jgi:hypothetical protein